MNWKERFSNIASQVTETVAPIVREALEETTNPDNYILDDYVPSDEEEHPNDNPKWNLNAPSPEPSRAIVHPSALQESQEEAQAEGEEDTVAAALEDRRPVGPSIEDLTLRLAEQEKASSAVESTLRDRIADLERARVQEKQEAEEQLSDLSATSQRLASRVDELESELARAEAEAEVAVGVEAESAGKSGGKGLVSQRSSESSLKEAKGVEERLEERDGAAEVAKARNELRLERERNARLEAENARLQQELAVVTAEEAAEDAAQVEALQRRIEELEEDLRKEREEVDQLKVSHAASESEAKGSVVVIAEEKEALLRQLEEAAAARTALERALSEAATAKEMLVAGVVSEREELSRVVTELENDVRSKDAALAKASSLSEQLGIAKAEADRLLSENEALEEKVGRLQSELSAKSKEQGINRSTVSGQLEEIERLRRAESSLKGELSALKEELSLHAESQQHVNKLASELAATSADLRVAEADRDRQVIELGNLNDALEALEIEVIERKKKLQLADHKLSELQSRVDASEAQKGTLEAQLEGTQEKLNTVETALAEAEAEKKRLTGQVSELSELVSLRHEEGRKGEGTEAEGDSSDKKGAESEEEILKTSIVKKLLVTYFSNEQANKSQVLVLIANVIGMTEEEKEKIGIIGGKVLRRSDQIKDKLDSLLTKSSPIISRVLFGPQEQESKPPVDWDAIEKVVSEKSFADLLTDFVANDI